MCTGVLSRTTWVALCGAVGALSACAPPFAVSEAMGTLVVASEATPTGLRGVAYRAEDDGTLVVVAKAERAGDVIRFARRGFEGVRSDIDDVLDGVFADTGVRDPRRALPPTWLNLVLSVAVETAEASCDVDEAACEPAWTDWAAAPESARFSFDDVDRTRAASLVTEGMIAAPATSKRISSCQDFPGYDGDQVCTGWAGRVVGPEGARDILPCCAAHDACYFDCPLEADDACRGTECIGACNTRLAGCCTERGGDPATCATFEIATDLAGGGGRNGCGRAKAEQFCADLSVDESGCEVERCVCEECRALFPEGASCDACDCTNDCLPIDAPTCFVDGVSHGIRTCRFVDYGGVGCFKWQDTRCDVASGCVVDAAGDPTCVPAKCPGLDGCDAPGVVESACLSDGSGDYFRTCAYDTDGCLGYVRTYCDAGGIGRGTCVVVDGRPLCLSE